MPNEKNLRLLSPTETFSRKSLRDEGLSQEDLRFLVVNDGGSWLSSAYAVLRADFDPEVIDPEERYSEWLALNRANRHPFPYLMVVAFYVVGEEAQIAGVCSGNIMSLGKTVDRGFEDWIFAIGHLVTNRTLRRLRVRGVGTALLERSVSKATQCIKRRGGRLSHVVLEAERESVGFWTKVGFRWPRGVRYWQPPLEFLDDGHYKHLEVPEILMLRPTDPCADSVLPKMVMKIVETLYENWSLAKYRETLTAEAFEHARSYVMGNLFRRVRVSLTSKGPLPLVEIGSSEEDEAIIGNLLQ